MFDNTIGLVSSLPTAIQSFYSNEVRSEATGLQVSEPYDYIDENGDTQSSTRLVDEYADVTYIVENPRYDLKSWSSVDAVITHSKGNNDSFIDYCIGKANESDSWVYHDEYITYLGTEPLAEDEKYLETVIDSDPLEYVYDFTADHAAWVLLAPVEGSYPTVAQWKIDNYTQLRRAAYGRWEEQLDKQFDNTWNAHITAIRDNYPSE